MASEELSPRQRGVALAALVAMLLYAIAGMLPEAPVGAWRMFVGADRYTYTLVDRHGQPEDMRAHVARNAYLVHHQFPLRVAGWLAKREPGRAPFSGTVTHSLRDGSTRRFRFRANGDGTLEWAVDE